MRKVLLAAVLADPTEFGVPGACAAARGYFEEVLNIWSLGPFSEH